jgi:hypothetical protein
VEEVTMFQCHHCGAHMTLSVPIPRDAECDGCRKDLRCCINCRHHDTRYNNACKETEADPVPDKDRRNFCEFFEFSREPFTAGGTGRTAREAEARRKLDALFGGSGTGERKGLKGPEDLFGKGGGVE